MTDPATFALPTSPGVGSVLLPALLLAALAAAALVAARRRRRPGRLLEVLETQGLGPRRSLVVARMGDEILVLGASEAGIALLSTRPAPAAAAAAPASPAPGPTRRPWRGWPAWMPARLAEALSRLRRFASRWSRPEPGFDALLAESQDDLELRRKLAAGRVGSVR